MYDISVIIPVYNVSDTIERCAVSLFAQTKKEMQYIFINDCTPDNSVELLESLLNGRFPELRDQVQIINLEKNSGQGTARRIGLKAAEGSYVAFCDSDDWVEPTCYEKMYACTDSGQVDIVVCDYFEEYKQKTVVHHEKAIDSNPVAALRDSYKNYFKQYLWNKLLKRSVLEENDIELEKGINLWEDELYLDRMFLCSKSLKQTSEPLYHYNKANMKSTTRVVQDKHIRQLKYVTDVLTTKYAMLEGFERVTDFLQFRCRIQLLRDKKSDLELYRTTYPESGKYIKEYDLSGFSTLGKLRIKLIQMHMEPLCIYMAKLKSMLGKV